MNKNLDKATIRKAKLRNLFLYFKIEKKRKKVNTTNKEVFVKHFPRKIKEEYFNNFKQNTLSNKSQVVAKRFNVNIWAFRTLNQLFKRSFLYSN